MGITIYDLRTSHNRHPEFGDFVMCQHCGRYMLVNFGEDDCPICGEHTLQWADYRQSGESGVFRPNGTLYG